eukprot:232779-Rhodomonas_salina.1
MAWRSQGTGTHRAGPGRDQHRPFFFSSEQKNLLAPSQSVLRIPSCPAGWPHSLHLSPGHGCQSEWAQ